MHSRKKTGATKKETPNSDSNIYGRYRVTNKTIQMMETICMQANAILDPLDKFYKENFSKLESGYSQVNTIVHNVSTCINLFGLGKCSIAKLFSMKDSEGTIMEKIQLGGLAISSYTTAGQILNGGAWLVRVLDWLMPHMKKSKVLVKVSEKFWNLTRQDIHVSRIHKMMDQYMMEHYEIKFGMTKGQGFIHYHNVVNVIDNHHQRRAFENAVFAAERALEIIEYNFVAVETDMRRIIEARCGIFLNLVRAGMCSKQDIDSGVANDIVDKLYDSYVSMESITPRVEIDPGKRMIG